MLCVTNGDSAGDRIRESGLPGEVLSWRDVLHEGPVPFGLSLEELREVRARFVVARGWGGFEEVLESFARRDAVVSGFRDHEEVVLMFERDLFDQLQSIQLLDWFGRQDLGTTRLSLVLTDEYLGGTPPDRLRALFRDRREASAEQLELGREAWEAFRSPDPACISTLLQGNMSALPFLEGALSRHLEQFPSTKNGLSRSESQALEEISSGRSVLRDAFVASHGEREDPVFLGDTVFASYLEDLSDVREPLVLFEDGGKIKPPRQPADSSGFWEKAAVVTETGRAVLEGRQDRIELNGLERWLGGVHLTGEAPSWRWDEAAQRLRRGGA